jgi:ABC-type uncharacterized transport system substrate-binding protein
VIVAGVGPTTLVLQQVSRTVPIVMAQAIDPVGSGFVKFEVAKLVEHE